MKKETLYLDTSVISAYCDERAMERQEATVKFEHLVKVKTRKTVSLSNILAGYKEVEIVSPQEL